MPAYTVVMEPGPVDEWLALRRLGVGASDTPAILGESPWSSPLSVYTEKLGLNEELNRDYLTWGKTIEQSLRAYLVKDQDFIEEYGAGWKALEDQRLIRSKKWPWMQCTLDAWFKAPGKKPRRLLGELKNSRDYDAWKETMPYYVYLQIQHQMAVAGQDEELCIACVGGAPPGWYHVERNDELIEETIVPKTKEFWERLQALEAPEVDGHKATAKALAALAPADNGKVIMLPSSFCEIDERLEEIHYEKKTLEGEEIELKNQIRHALGAASIGRLSSGKKWTYTRQMECTYTTTRTATRVLRGPRRSKRG